jgi:hypothetical protein
MDGGLRLQLSEEGADAEQLDALAGCFAESSCSLTWRRSPHCGQVSRRQVPGGWMRPRLVGYW